MEEYLVFVRHVDHLNEILIF